MTPEKFEVPATSASLSMVRNRIRKYLGRVGVDKRETGQIVLATDEAVANVIEHGYREDGVSKVEVEISKDDREVRLSARDRSKPAYDPTRHRDPNIEEHLKAGHRGGLGIFLIRKMMDDMRHSVLAEGINELVMVKRIGRR